MPAAGPTGPVLCGERRRAHAVALNRKGRKHRDPQLKNEAFLAEGPRFSCAFSDKPKGTHVQEVCGCVFGEKHLSDFAVNFYQTGPKVFRMPSTGRMRPHE